MEQQFMDHLLVQVWDELENNIDSSFQEFLIILMVFNLTRIGQSEIIAFARNELIVQKFVTTFYYQ